MNIIQKLLPHGDRQRHSMKAELLRFFKTYNCQWREVSDRPGFTQYCFDYQSGHFVADVPDSDRSIDITYPGFLDVEADDLDLVRALVNHHNRSNTLVKFFYASDEEDNRIYLHMSFFLNAVWVDEMPDLLNAFFLCQRRFCDEFRQVREKAGEHDITDVEYHREQLQREHYLLRMQEIAHQGNHDASGGAVGHRGLSSLLERMLGLKRVKCHALNCGDGLSAMNAGDIDDLDLPAIVACRPQESPFAATVELTVGDDPARRQAMVLFTPDTPDESGQSPFCRVTAMLVPESPARAHSLNSASQLPLSNSVIVALGDNDTDKRRAEFDYMWKDAMLKRRDGEPLDELQQFVIDITDANIGYNMYWGRKLMLNRQYCEALAHLENAFNALRTLYLDMDHRSRNAFAELCYCIGFCYTELRLYRDAFYYLDLLTGDGNVRHTTELINALANGKDYRLFAVTDDIHKAITEQYDKEDDIPDGLRDFIHFMRRRRAYSLIDFGQLDKAEKSFTAMLDEPENRDYALSELAYIKQLRKKQQPQEPKTDN